MCDPVGTFGYVVRHTGAAPVEVRNVQFTGPALKAVPGQPNTYWIQVTQDGVAAVTAHAEPTERTTLPSDKIAVFLDAGVGIHRKRLAMPSTPDSV
jgi:hypothetical protein